MDTLSLDAGAVRAAVSTGEAIEAVRTAMIDLAAGAFEQPVRTAMRSGQFLVMSAHHLPSATAIVKALSLNFERVPAIHGTVAWSEWGRAISLIADAGAVTGLRTGAISGVATDLLAAPDADTMAMVGAGGQAPDQVRSVHAVRPLRRLWVFDRDPVRAEQLASSLASELTGVDIEVAATVESAVAEAAIVSCATPATEPVIQTHMLMPRVHVNAIGAFRPTMRELPDDLLAESTIVIDDLEAILEESGEILHALAAGAIGQDELITLGRALADPPQRRDRTVFKTVGVAAQDWAIARVLASKLLADGTATQGGGG